MRQVGPYQVLEELARGGMGVVYRARDTQTGRVVALKLMLGEVVAHPTGRKRFLREAQALAKVEDPRVVRAFDFGVDPRGNPYLVMEWVEGESLQARLDRSGPLGPAEAAELVGALCGALAACHRAGVLHRDLKPANVLLGPDGAPKLTDFGLARDVDPSTSRTALTEAGHLLGSPGFWAPEQARGELEQVGARTDVYGLGGLLFALLTGVPPHPGESLVEVLAQTLQPAPRVSTLTPSVPAWLDRVVARALSVDPAARFPSAEALGAALEAGAAQPTGRPRSAWVATGLLCGLGLLGAGAILLGGRSQPRATPPPASATPPPASATPTPSPPRAAAASAADVEASQAASDEALARYGAQRLEEAVTQADEALRLWPENAQAHVVRGAARRLLGDLPAAIADYDRAILLRPDLGHAFGNRGYARFLQGDVEGAAEDLERALELDPVGTQAAQTRELLGTARDVLDGRQPEGFILSDAREDYTRGSEFLQRGRHAEAVACFSQALAKQPSCASAYLGRGLARVELGRLPEALDDCDQALRWAPQSGKAYSLRTVIHVRRGEWRAARADGDQALRRGGVQRDITHYYRGVARQRLGDPEGAVEDFNLALRLAPERAEAYQARGEALAALSNWPEARRDLEVALQWGLGPQLADAARRSLQQVRQREQASTGGAEGDAGAAYEEGCTLHGAGRLQEAAEAYTRAIGIQPDHAQAYLRRGAIHSQLHRYQAAADDYTRAIQHAPDSKLAFSNRAVARTGLGDHAGALDDLDQALRIDPDFAPAHFQRGLVRVAQADWQGAADAYARVIQLAPEGPILADAQARLEALRPRLEPE